MLAVLYTVPFSIVICVVHLHASLLSALIGYIGFPYKGVGYRQTDNCIILSRTPKTGVVVQLATYLHRIYYLRTASIPACFSTLHQA